MQATDVSEDIGRVLRRHRIDAGLTQEALAERAEVGLRSIQGIERGERRPHRGTLERLVSALGLSVEQRRRLEGLARRSPRPRRTAAPPRLALVKPGWTETGTAPRSRLPASLTSFVGRQREIVEIKRLLAGAPLGSRLVTLTGPPGVGKTRLALEVAADLVEDFADGVRFVPLAAVRDADLVLPALAQAVRVEGYEGEPLVDRLVDALKERHLLFILDNFEQVEAAAPLVAQLLEGCPRLVVLATSRSSLRVRGEREFVVPPLAVPDPSGSGARPADATSAAGGAVRLFVDRARDVGIDLVLDRENAGAIAEICRRLDGLPLAIELAAARSKILAPPALLSRLADRLGILTAGPRDLPPRQQALRDAVAWSYDLLDAEDGGLFRRLAVFAGGFTIEAASRVCGATLGRLASLVDKSLLQVEAPLQSGGNGEPRFRMLETLQEFARDRLAASGDDEALRTRHAAYFLALAEQSDPGDGIPDVGRLKRLDGEQGNLQAALRYLIDRADGERAARLAAALTFFWKTRGVADEALAWMGEALELLGGSDRSPLRARLLFEAAGPAFRHSDNALARRRVEESVAIYRELGDRRGVAAALRLDGLIARWQGQYDLAWQRFEEQRAIWRELGDQLWIAESDDMCGVVAFWMGDGARGRALLESALADFRRLGNRMQVGFVLYNLGFVAHGLGDYPAARACYEERLALAREVGFRMGIGEVLGGLGDLALDRGDLDGARAHLGEALAIHRDLGNRREIAHVLECFAGLAALQDQRERAVRLWSAATALRRVIEEPIPPDQGIRLGRRLGRLREVAGEEAFARAWAEGQAMTLGEAIAVALLGGEQPHEDGSPHARRSTAFPRPSSA